MIFSKEEIVTFLKELVVSTEFPQFLEDCKESALKRTQFSQSMQIEMLDLYVRLMLQEDFNCVLPALTAQQIAAMRLTDAFMDQLYIKMVDQKLSNLDTKVKN